MKLLAAGGGSGGHVTPVLAVINELARHDPALEVLFVCDRAFKQQAIELMKEAVVPVTVRVISAGKFRRYHGVRWYQQLVDVPTNAKNIRDSTRLVAGLWQSLRVMKRFNPDVVFAKGGYVCLPVGMAARIQKRPMVIHDSDARAGLTSRVLARWAAAIATGAPLENYPSYPAARSQYVGVPIREEFHPYEPSEQRQAKQAIGVVDIDRPLLVVTGGGLGAQSINQAVCAIAPRILEANCSIYHVTGKAHYDDTRSTAVSNPAYQIVPFVSKNMAQVLGAADIVITRGSATFTQELAALKKPIIMIPAAHLGDQIKNAKVYKADMSAIVIDDQRMVANPEILYQAIRQLLDDPAQRQQLSTRLGAYARSDAAARVAGMIMAVASQYHSKGTAS